MPICNDNFNGCFSGPYYPRPIFNCCSSGSCGGGNNVVNPTRSAEWGFFSNQNQQVNFLQAVPLNLVNSSGKAITQGNNESIMLTSGNYLVTFSVAGSSSSNPIRFVLSLNGEVLPYSLTAETGDGSPKNLSTSVVLSSTNNSSLQLLNQTDGQVSILNANLSVTKLLI